MKYILKEYGIELFSIVLVFVNIFFHILPAVPLVLFLISLSLFRSGLLGSFVLSSYALPVVLGSALYAIGITGVATLIQVLLFFICIYQWRVKRRFYIYNFSEAIKPLIYVFIIFVLSSLITSGGNFAFIKCKDSILNGIIAFFSFAFMFSNPGKYDCRRIGLYLILYSFLMLLLSPQLNNGSGPIDFFDFGYLRRNNMLVLEDESFTIDYQHVGTFATLGCAMIMLHSLWRKDSIHLIIIGIVLCTLSSLYSGARQSMIISVALIFLWSIFQENNKKNVIIYAGVGIVVVVMLVRFLFADGGMLNSVKEDGYLEASNRDLVLLKGVSDFLNNPIIGVGYGRFFFGKYGLYPHNLIVELLCEIGIIGFVFIFALSIKPIINLRNYKPCLYLLVVYILRSMTSGGMDSNIMLFGFVFSTICLYSMDNNKKNYL